MSQQQTVLRVLTNVPGTITGTTQYEFLDLYDDIPIKINKSYAELQDIAKKNSDYSVGLQVPGSKKNNRFFENFFNVDSASLYFDATKRIQADVLQADVPLFRGYLRLNKVSVLNSKVEYDITLYSNVGDLFGSIGNNLLKDMNFSDEDYHFNHTFSLSEVTAPYNYTNFSVNGEKPYPYFYPIVHNGYVYSGDTVTFSGSTTGGTRFYTSTNSTAGTLGSYATQAAAWADGNQQYHINSPGQGLQDNQLKPALNIWSIIQLMFKTYGYTIKSDFFNTPWMKSLYMYGYFSSPQTKFSYKINNIEELPLSGIELVFFRRGDQFYAIPTKKGSNGIPCYCLEDISYTAYFNYFGFTVYFNGNVIAGTPFEQTTASLVFTFLYGTSLEVSIGSVLKYFPVPVGSEIAYMDGDEVNFSVVIDQNIKQIDILSSIAKKFNLLFIPDPDVPKQFIVEPYDFYVGTGEIYDWTAKLSWDKGFTVEPAINFIESSILLTDAEDNDEGNREFKARNNRIYGQNNIYNPTDFKSQEKKIDTIFSPELIRKWDKDGVNNIGTPLGINYAASSQEIDEGNSTRVTWQYTGVKTKPKLFFWMGGFNPFLDVVGETFNAANPYSTYSIYVTNSLETAYFQSDRLPVISHTMPLGLSDADKINNDSLCILFNSEQPTNIGVQTFNTYTENDAYNKFYNNRITNIYDPNTRFLSGYFDLKYSDIQNLKPNDVIKINEQHFVINKLSEFNLTNRELTKVELIQFNVNPQEYPDRYFQYYYCDNPSTIFKFKTDFINPNLLDTNYGWSVYYDHQVGSLTGQTSGFTSAFTDINVSNIVYVPYTMYEVNKSDYESSGIDWSNDSLHNYIYIDPSGPFLNNMPTFWLNSGTTVTGVNVFNDCAQFQTARTTYGILTGSSINHGAVTTPTPTPTLTPTPTPAASSVIRGSLLVTMNGIFADTAYDGYAVYVNGEIRDNQFIDSNDLYSTFLYPGDIVQILMFDSAITTEIFSVYRRDYTTTNANGDMGIVDSAVPFTQIYSGDTFNGWQFTATTINCDYNFEYRATLLAVTPTPTPTPTPVPNFCQQWYYYNAEELGPQYIGTPLQYIDCNGNLVNVFVSEFGTGPGGGIPIGAINGYICISGGTSVTIFDNAFTANFVTSPCPTPTPTPTRTPTPTPSPTPALTINAQYVYNWTGLPSGADLNITGKTSTLDGDKQIANFDITGSTGTKSGSTVVLLSTTGNQAFDLLTYICRNNGVNAQLTGQTTTEFYINNVLNQTITTPTYPFNEDYTIPPCGSNWYLDNTPWTANLSNGDTIKFVTYDNYSSLIPTGSTFEYVYTWSNAPSQNHDVDFYVGGTGGGWQEDLINNVTMSGRSGTYSGSTVVDYLAGNPYANLDLCVNASGSTAQSVTMARFDNNVFVQSATTLNSALTFCPINTGSTEQILVGNTYPYNATIRYENNVVFNATEPKVQSEYTWSGATTVNKNFQIGYYFPVLSGYSTYSTTSTAASGIKTTPNAGLTTSYIGTQSPQARIRVCKASGTMTRDYISATLLVNGVTIQTLNNATDVSITTCGTYVDQVFTFNSISINSGDQIKVVWSDTFK